MTTIIDMGDLQRRSLPELIDIALACEEGPKFWYVAGLIAGHMDEGRGNFTTSLLNAGRSWDYAAAYRLVAKLKNPSTREDV